MKHTLTGLLREIVEETQKKLYNVYRADIYDPSEDKTFYLYGYSSMTAPRTNNAGYWWTYKAKQAKVDKSKGAETAFVDLMTKLNFDSAAGEAEEIASKLTLQQAKDLINSEIQKNPKNVLNLTTRRPALKVPKAATIELKGELYINPEKIKDHLKDVTFEDSNLTGLSKEAIKSGKSVEVSGKGKYYRSPKQDYIRV